MATNTAKYEVVLNSLTQKFNNVVQAAEPFYPQVCYVNQSSRLTETYGMLGSIPGVREWTGDRVYNELRGMDFSVTNKLWEDSLAIPKTNVDDDILGMYGPVIENMAIEASYHPDELLMSSIINGSSTTCWDSQYFFDTDHSWGSSGTQSNAITQSVSNTAAVTALEFRSGFDAARVKLLQYKNDQGKYLNRTTIKKMSSLLVLCPPELETSARTAFQASVLNNATVVILDAPQIVATPLLTSATSFYVFNVGNPLKPFVFQAREPLSTQTSGANDIETKDLKFMTQARYAIGYFAWWTAVKVTVQ